MNRTDLHTLADKRIAEAEVLLQNGLYEGAYYLAGYAVECALKAYIAKQIREHDFPDKKLVNDSYTHDPSRLLGLSGLRGAYDQAANSAPDLKFNWTVVKDWSERDRYAVAVDEQRARNLFEAITNDPHDILTWLKPLW